MWPHSTEILHRAGNQSDYAFVQPTVRPCDLRDVLLMLPLPLPLVVVRRLLLIRGRFRCISLGFALHPK